MPNLRLVVRDQDTGEITPCRVEISDSGGNFFTAADALRVPGDCTNHPEPRDLTFDDSVAELPTNIQNLYAQSTQFYTDGQAEVQLEPGEYRVRLFKGPEFHTVERTLSVEGAADQTEEFGLERWIDMRERGWYSADDHLHIARSVPEMNPLVSKVMQAEDIRVANLLQMGLADRFHIAPQYSFGSDGEYWEHGYLLVSGQENPRTFLGHSIVLGSQESIHLEDDYLIYRLFWKEARRQGGIAGWAHFGTEWNQEMGGGYGLPIALPHDLLTFIEVLQFNGAVYGSWYDILNMGFRITPTAGTDFPCGGANIPGRERFYTKIEEPFTHQAWLDGVRRSKTFVTSGPMIEFSVDGQSVGDEMVLQRSGVVQVSGTVAWDPDIDDVSHLELVENGVLAGSFPSRIRENRISFQVEHHLRESAWLAVRAWGTKFGEMAGPAALRSMGSTSTAHSSPIFVTIEGTPPIQAQSRSRDAARAWHARLVDLETRLTGERIEDLAERSASSTFDTVSRERLLAGREQLLEEIDKGKRFFEDLRIQTTD